MAECDDFWDRIGTVKDLLDSIIQHEELAEARHAHLSKLVERDTFGLCLVEEFDRSCELFPHCWVDKKRSGIVKCRFTVANMKKATVSML